MIKKKNYHKIKILSKDITNKIAAGEVIDRPASVVKELIENSLDANSKNITIEIEKSGKKLIKVYDDGVGMSPEDAKIACKRFSTSKISNLEDLQRIFTLGFRGEALSSIASVSQLQIITRSEGFDIAYELSLEASEVKNEQMVARNQGTTIIVRNLFFNTPARRKFYKTDITEISHIVNIVSNFILSFPDISFKLVHSGKEIFNIPRNLSFKERIAEVLGKEIKDNLVPVKYSCDIFELSGYIGKPGYSRMDRRKQLFFVNKRYIQNSMLSHAVFQAYQTLLEKGRYPVAILFIKIKPDLIDVNVHPSKLEIKFLDSNIIHDKVVLSINQKLNNFKKENIYNFRKDSFNIDGSKNTISDISFIQKEDFLFKNENLKEKSYVKELSYLQRYQLNKTYILEIFSEKIRITDQHAAHERILFEVFLRAWQSKKIEKQNLLLPYRVDLSKQECLVLNRSLELFSGLGFEIEEFGGNSFNIQSIPAVLKEKNVTKVFLDILDDLDELTSHQSKIPEEFIKIASCRAAIKSGDSLNITEMDTLLKDLDRCKLPYTCPHGRPSQIEIGIKELEKRFKRR